MLKLDLPYDEDTKCCFCPLENVENLREHLDTCLWRVTFDELDIRTKLMDKDLDRLRFQHIDIFCKLVFNDLIPVKEDLTDFCLKCTSYDEHIKGQCLKMNRLEAFDLVTQKMHHDELLIKFKYIDVKVEKMIALASEKQQKDRLEAEKEFQEEHDNYNSDEMSSRALRCAKREKHQRWSWYNYYEKKSRKLIQREAERTKHMSRNDVIRTVASRINKARELLTLSDEYIPSEPMFRFISTMPGGNDYPGSSVSENAATNTLASDDQTPLSY